MAYRKRYKRPKQGKRRYKRRGKRRGKPRSAPRPTYRAVKRMIKSAVAKADEWGQYDPYNFSATLGSTGEMVYAPVEGATNTNTSHSYNSGHGIITEFLLHTALGDSGLESREGRDIAIKRIMFRTTCNANPNYPYRFQNLRIYFIRVSLEHLTNLDGSELNTWYNHLLQSIKQPGQCNSEIDEKTRATRDTYKILKSFKYKCSLSSDGTELIGLKRDHNKMFKCNWPFRFQKTVGTAAVEPMDSRLFIVYKFGNFQQSVVPNLDEMPELKTNMQIWYTV